MKVIALTCPTTTLILLTIAVFQATERKIQPIIISTLRKGVLDIPMMFMLNHFFKIKGLVWAVPLADLGALLIAISMFIPFVKRLQEEVKQQKM